MQNFLSLLTPSGVGALTTALIVAGIASGFMLYHVFKSWQERRQEQGVRWYRRAMILLGIATILLSVTQILNVVVLALTVHQYVPSEVDTGFTFLGIVSGFLWFAIIIYVAILRVQGRRK